MNDTNAVNNWRVCWQDFRGRPVGLRCFAPDIQFLDFSTEEAARAHANALKASGDGHVVVSVSPTPSAMFKRGQRG